MSNKSLILYWLMFSVLCGLALHAQSPDLAGIAHVAFRVSDLAKTRDFYTRLGFEQAFEFTDGGKTSVAFIKVNDHQFIELYPRAADSQLTGLMHICFEAQDIESAHRAYVERELQPGEIKKARAGNLLFILHDPEDQILEYTQYMPDSLHSQDRGKHMAGHRIATHLLEATSLVKDMGTEREFYSAKLGLGRTGSTGREFFVAGDSGDRVALQPQTATAKSQIVFGVDNLAETARDLRVRGFQVRKNRAAVSVVDPDGTLVTFVPQPRAPKK